MEKRRSFFKKLFGISLAGTAISMNIPALAKSNAKTKFIHQVYFWLKNPESSADNEKIVTGLKEMGTILKSLRLNKGFFQRDIAQATNTSVAYVCKLETGGYLPSPKYLEAFCNTFPVIDSVPAISPTGFSLCNKLRSSSKLVVSVHDSKRWARNQARCLPVQ